MAVRASGSRIRDSWVVWAFCAAAATLVLVEASAGMEYVGTGLAQILINVLGWMPALSLIPMRLAEQSVWHRETLDLPLLALPLAVLAFFIVVLGMNARKRGHSTRRQSAKSKGDLLT
jgi:hypothetical protein